MKVSLSAVEDVSNGAIAYNWLKDLGLEPSEDIAGASTFMIRLELGVTPSTAAKVLAGVKGIKVASKWKKNYSGGKEMVFKAPNNGQIELEYDAKMQTCVTLYTVVPKSPEAWLKLLG